MGRGQEEDQGLTVAVELTKSAFREFRDLPPAIQGRFRAAIDALAEQWPVTRIDIKRLQGSEAWRLRVGQYRAVFQAAGDALVFTRFAHRSKVYNV